jgi:hypothetical protein
MPNPDMAELIAQKLRTGLTHPGYPDKGIEPTAIPLPFVSKAGMPKEMSDLMDGTAKLLSEAIIDIEETDGDCEIVPRGEARSLRRAAGDKMPTTMLVYCRCDKKRADPLISLTVTDPDNIVIDGPTLIRGLARREAKHPHAVIKPGGNP